MTMLGIKKMVLIKMKVPSQRKMIARPKMTDTVMVTAKEMIEEGWMELEIATRKMTGLEKEIPRRRTREETGLRGIGTERGIEIATATGIAGEIQTMSEDEIATGIVIGSEIVNVIANVIVTTETGGTEEEMTVGADLTDDETTVLDGVTGTESVNATEKETETETGSVREEAEIGIGNKDYFSGTLP